jgi:hypothetical protein
MGLPDEKLKFLCEYIWVHSRAYPEVLSASDAEHMGHGKLSRKAFERAVEIITANLDKLHQDARRLIRSLRVKNNREEQLKLLMARLEAA